MNLMLLRIFQEQVALQCRFMVRAAIDVNTGLGRRDPEQTFYALQNFLNAGANVSKALWGQGGKFEKKRRALRDSIGVDNNSPLKQVTMRNNFEHFDERLDQWWKQSKRHNYIDLNLMSRPGIIGANKIDCFRTFDPSSSTLTFWSQDFNLKELMDEVQKILPRLETEAAKPH
jgi:hypothetical protein